MAFGDVIGANVAMCLVALGVGAVIAPLPFGTWVRRYGLVALPAGAACAVIAWGGHVSRLAGGLLMAAYIAYVGVIWALEGQPPALGEASELNKAQEKAATTTTRRPVGRDLVIIVAGIVAMSVGATLLVEGVHHLAKTTELAMYLAAIVAVVLTALIVGGHHIAGTNRSTPDPFNALDAIRYITYLTIGYMIARGLAKSGSRDAYDA